MSLEIYGLDLRVAKKMLFTGVNLRIDKPNLVVYVIDEQGNFIEGADVNILSAGHDLDSVTDALGTALTRFMPAINNTLTVSKEGYATSTQIIYNETPSTLSVYVQLYASEIRLKVVNNQNEPIEGATCRVLNAIGGGNNVLSFDGVDDYVQATKVVNAYPLTIEALVKRTKSGDQSIVSIAHPSATNVYYKIGISASNTARITARNTTAVRGDGTTVLANDTYYRVSGVFNSNTDRKLYVNGELEASSTTNVAFNTAVDRTLIGTLRAALDVFFFGGNISDIRIWNKARSQAEIQGDMYERLNGDETNLAEYWKLDEGSGTLVNGLSNDGTIYGATWAEVSDLPIVTGIAGYDTDTPYDSQTTNSNGLTTLNYQIDTVHGLEVTLPGKRRFIMPFKRTTRGLLDWQVMLSDYLATFATDRGNILINSEPENNDANFLIE